MILDLALPRVVTARAMRTALVRAFDARTGLRLAYARANRLSPSDVSRAIYCRLDRPESLAPLDRVAFVQGYVPHPAMPGHYRRVEVEVVPDIDPELERLRDEARAEAEIDIGPDPMFADLEDLAACERFLEQLTLEPEAA